MAAAVAAIPPEPLDLLGDGRLTKRVLAEGSGALPEPGGQVEVHYVCRAAGGGEVLDSSRERGYPLAFALGDGEAIPGLEHAVATMRCGELASLRVHADLAFGAAGAAGGAVPPCGPAGEGARGTADGSLDFELELVSAAPRALWEDGSELSQEERLARAARLKEAGNAGFKAEDCAAAARDYRAALALLGFEGRPELAEDKDAWPDVARQEARGRLVLACFLNLAQCELRLEQFVEAAKHASEALELDPSNSKAVYRRGLARLGAGHAELAREDLLESARREPRNAEIRARLQECQGKMRATELSARSTFGGMFGRGSIYDEKAEAPAEQQRAAEGEADS